MSSPRKWCALAVAVLLLAGCDAAATATSSINTGGDQGTPVSRPYSLDFLSRARAFLAALPPYHRHHWHNAVLLAASITPQGDWHGIALEPDGTMQPLDGGSHEDSYALAQETAAGDYIEFNYHYADLLNITYGSPALRILRPGAVQP